MEYLTEILTLLKQHYGVPKTALRYDTPFQLLVATILSAQCTDKRVNIVTKELFKELQTPKDLGNVSQERLEILVKSTGFYRNKAKNIIATAKKIENDFNSKVPRTMDELLTLPGVARKTANIVLSHGFGITEGIAIDTHCIRLTNRFKWVKSKNAIIIERELMKELPKRDWTTFTNLLIAHGRATCTARKPDCENCFINKVCPSAFKVSNI
ncbi:endonuclease III [archaeon]|nr:endonuclease III [archaeon]|tara:strand:- start:430 stop:1065 length:636 start_codon:yes stop_codon:yes gene_type:complete